MRQIKDDASGRVPGVVKRPTAPPPATGGQPNGGAPTPPPTDGYVYTPPAGGSSRDPNAMAVSGGPGRSVGDRGTSQQSIARQTAQQNVGGATPFMQTPGMQIASQRISGQGIQDDPAISAALQDFYTRTAPQIQNQATRAGLGRSTAALNAMQQAQGSMLAPMYEQAFGREQTRLGNLNAAAENELGRRERSSQRVADANQNMAQLLMQMSGQQFGQQQQAGQNIMQAGGQLRDISQQGNDAALNDFLRRQSLSEQAVYAPFGGLAGGGLGSTTSQTGK